MFPELGTWSVWRRLPLPREPQAQVGTGKGLAPGHSSAAGRGQPQNSVPRTLLRNQACVWAPGPCGGGFTKVTKQQRPQPEPPSPRPLDCPVSPPAPRKECKPKIGSAGCGGLVFGGKRFIDAALLTVVSTLLSQEVDTPVLLAPSSKPARTMDTGTGPLVWVCVR